MLPVGLIVLCSIWIQEVVRTEPRTSGFVGESVREKSGSFNTIDTDVLIIGGGIAACLAAIEAKRKGVDVVLVDKAHVGRSGNSPLMSGILTMFDADDDDYDSWFRHCFETGCA